MQMTTEKRIEIFHNMGFDADVEKWLIVHNFFIMPASTKYHGNYEGGLFDHSLAVTDALVDMTALNSLTWQEKRSPFVVGMFHDLCKIDQYQIDNSVPYKEGEPTRYEYRKNTMYKGHGDKSVILLSALMKLTEEEIACIRYHMGAFTDKEEWNDYTGAIHVYPNVLWTHQADMIASHIRQI
jgi:hypothetical protein